MYCVTNQNQFLIDRGDTKTFRFPLFETSGVGRVPYVLKQDDVVYFGVMECNQAFEDALIRKKLVNNDFTDNVVTVKFSTTDTENLRTGKYFVSMKLVSGLDVTTVLPLTEFWITGTDKKV